MLPNKYEIKRSLKTGWSILRYEWENLLLVSLAVATVVGKTSYRAIQWAQALLSDPWVRLSVVMVVLYLLMVTV
jgi:hypothetical protein